MKEIFLGDLRSRVQEAMLNAIHNRVDDEAQRRADPTDVQYGSLLQVAIHMVDHCSDLEGENVNAVMREISSLRGQFFGV